MSKPPHISKITWIPLTVAILASLLIIHRAALADSQLILNTLLKTYRVYFAAIDAGAEMRQLPFGVKQKLAPHYAPQLLERVWYGESHNLVVKNTAMTDCNNIYFPSGSGMIDMVENGKLFDEKYKDNLRWLLHELTHSEQCEALGGRDAYAAAWFGELATTTITQLILDPGNVSEKLLHDAMPMEKKAEQKALKILSQAIF
jgi:hypothetical protein